MREPDSPWDEIMPLLWMGGHGWTDAAGEVRLAVVTGEFDLVISLIDQPGHGPDPGIEHRVGYIPDGPLRSDQIESVRDLAVAAADAVRQGRNTLVRCRSGYNRSGLVVAQTLMNLGHDSASAIRLIRERRSPHALHNEIFVAYLETGLDIAAMLAGLDS